MKLRDIATVVKGKISGSDDCEIQGAARIEDALPGDITFIANLKYKKFLRTTSASAVIISTDAEFEELNQRTAPVSLVRVSDPYQSFLQIVDLFYPKPRRIDKEIHPTAIIAQSAKIGRNTAVGAYAVIGEECTIGTETEIHPGTVLGDNVSIGSYSVLYPNVTVREYCSIGSRVIIHPGTVIGSDGFGFATRDDGSHEKIPQRGTVVIEDDVEIGANCAIDRATLGDTRIKRGAKLDNLIHIAHNVVVGEHTVIAAQSGVSGSTKIGNYCAFGGQVGLTGHISIADKTSIGAQSGVPKSITKPGKIYFGYPARELNETLKIQAAAGQLPSFLREFAAMRKRIEELERLIALRKPD